MRKLHPSLGVVPLAPGRPQKRPIEKPSQVLPIIRYVPPWPIPDFIEPTPAEIAKSLGATDEEKQKVVEAIKNMVEEKMVEILENPIQVVDEPVPLVPPLPPEPPKKEQLPQKRMENSKQSRYNKGSFNK